LTLKKKKFVGIVDVMDLLGVIIFLTEVKKIVDVIADKPVNWKEYITEEQKVLMDATAIDIANSSEKNPYVEVYEGLPLRSLMDMFGKDVNLHRVMVTTGERNAIGLVSQSNVIQFLQENKDHFPAKSLSPMKEWLVPKNNVVTVSIKTKTADAFQQLLAKRVSGVAVVDESGKLVGSLSSTDLKRSLSMNLFADLLLPVENYLGRTDSTFKPHTHSMISCTLDNSIADVVSKLSTNKIHRIFVVDQQGKPIHVLSLCDVIEFLNHQAS